MNVAELGKQAFMAELKRGLEACGLPVTQVEQKNKGGKRQVWLCSPRGEVVSEDVLWDVEQRSRGLPGGQTGLKCLHGRLELR